MCLTLRMLLCVLASLILGSGCGQSDTIESERDKLKGQWEVVSWEVNGQRIKEGADVGTQYEFDGDKYRIIQGPDKIGPWIKYDLDVDADPKVMKVNANVIKDDKIIDVITRESIYRIEGIELQIGSLNVLTPTKRHPTSFSSKQPHVRLLILKRIPFADPKEEKERLAAADSRKQMAAFYDLQPMVSGRYSGKFNVDFHDFPWTRNIGKRWWQDLLELRDIRKLVFHSCGGVSDEEMKLVGKLTSLEYLDLNSTDISDTGIANLNGLDNLETLDLSFTSASDKSVLTFVKMPKLKRLILKGTLITSTGIADLQEKRRDVEVVWRRLYTESQQKAAKEIARLGFEIDDDYDTSHRPKIVTCQISLNRYIKLQNPTPAKNVPTNPALKSSRYERDVEPALVAKYLEQLPSPIAITVVDEKMDNAIFTCLKKIQGLIKLDLSSTKVTDDGVADLKKQSSLKCLNLRGTRITTASIPVLASIPSLETLDLTRTSLNPADLEPLLKLDELKRLTVNRKQLSQEQNLQFRNKRVEIIIKD